MPFFIYRLKVIIIFISPESILKHKMSFYKVLNLNNIKVLNIKVDLILSMLWGMLAYDHSLFFYFL
jgi:hypothetical protein